MKIQIDFTLLGLMNVTFQDLNGLMKIEPFLDLPILLSECKILGSRYKQNQSSELLETCEDDWEHNQ